MSISLELAADDVVAALLSAAVGSVSTVLTGRRCSFNFSGVDGAIGSPEVDEKLKTGGVAPSNHFTMDGLDVDELNGGDELVAEGLASCLVDHAVGVLADKVLAVNFSKGGTSGARWMAGLDWWIAVS